MSDRDLVTETVRDILTAHEPFVLTPERPWDTELWAALAGSGMTGVGLPEHAGGSGGEPADAAAVVAALAAGAAAVPVAEQILAAGPALVAAGLALPDPAEPLTVAVTGEVRASAVGEGRYRLDGTLREVPWLGIARWAAVAADGVLALVDLADLPGDGQANLAGEPRGTLDLDGVQADGAVVDATQLEAVRARYALARAVQLSGALGQVLAWTVAYAGEREQFGRPLGRFQAIQMELAEMAGEVCATAALTDAAVDVLGRPDRLVLAAAAAKVRAGSAVEVVARLAHQVHGAIGFTQEHRLHHLTRRLWAWRDEAGNELHWARVLGAGVLRESPDSLWSVLTDIV